MRVHEREWEADQQPSWVRLHRPTVAPCSHSVWLPLHSAGAFWLQWHCSTTESWWHCAGRFSCSSHCSSLEIQLNALVGNTTKCKDVDCLAWVQVKGLYEQVIELFSSVKQCLNQIYQANWLLTVVAGSKIRLSSIIIRRFWLTLMTTWNTMMELLKLWFIHVK